LVLAHTRLPSVVVAQEILQERQQQVSGTRLWVVGTAGGTSLQVAGQVVLVVAVIMAVVAVLVRQGRETQVGVLRTRRVAVVVAHYSMGRAGIYRVATAPTLTVNRVLVVAGTPLTGSARSKAMALAVAVLVSPISALLAVFF